MLDWLRRHWHKPNGFRGVFTTHEDAASYYRDLLDEVQHDDYPALFWLARALESGRKLLEIGGHVGVAYYPFARHLGFPTGFHWTILDTPAVTEAGRRLAAERGRTDLSFVSSFEDVQHPPDILLAAGSLQYVPGPSLPARIRALRKKPRHLILNKTPVTDGPPFVTLQNIGVAFCPYRIFSRAELPDALVEDGYELVASWRKPRRIEVPGYPERSLDHYSGFYFALRD
jgi:putative methyltransferase (TIGR04325 family)